MNDTMITLHGWTGSDVRYRIAKGVSVANVRVAATPRIKKDGDWVDGETTWYSVTAWRTLADHLRDSLRKGDPVIVHGRLRTETWAPEGGPVSTTLQVDALLVGHDLTRGITHFIKRSDRVNMDEDATTPAADGSSGDTAEPDDTEIIGDGEGTTATTVDAGGSGRGFHAAEQRDAEPGRAGDTAAEPGGAQPDAAERGGAQQREGQRQGGNGRPGRGHVAA